MPGTINMRLKTDWQEKNNTDSSWLPDDSKGVHYIKQEKDIHASLMTRSN